METFFICLLLALGSLLLVLAGVFSGDTTPFVCLTFSGVLILMFAGGLVAEAACEKTLIECVNGEVAYDTVAVDKDGKLLEIKIKDN